MKEIVCGYHGGGVRLNWTDTKVVVWNLSKEECQPRCWPQICTCQKEMILPVSTSLRERVKDSVRCFITVCHSQSHFGETRWMFGLSAIGNNPCNLASVSRSLHGSYGPRRHSEHTPKWGWWPALVMPSGRADRRRWKRYKDTQRMYKGRRKS